MYKEEYEFNMKILIKLPYERIVLHRRADEK